MTYDHHEKAEVGERCVLCRARSGNLIYKVIVGRMAKPESDEWFAFDFSFPAKNLDKMIVDEQKSILPFSEINSVMAGHELRYLADLPLY